MKRIEIYDKYKEIKDMGNNIEMNYEGVCPAFNNSITVYTEHPSTAGEYSETYFVIELSANLFDKIEIMPSKENPENYSNIRATVNSTFSLPHLENVVKDLQYMIDKLKKEKGINN